MGQKKRYINEQDAVREVLMVLQCRINLLLKWIHDAFAVSPTAPRLLHLTVTSYESILTSFAQTATSVQRLRKFVSTVFRKASQSANITNGPGRLRNSGRRKTCTLEAFADAVDQEIRAFDKWCANREAAMCQAQGGVGPPLIVSLLSLEKALRDAFSGAFSILLDVLQKVLDHTSRSPQAVTEV